MIRADVSSLEKDINKFLKGVAAESPDTCYAAMLDTGRDIEARAKVLVHKKTGNLARSITHQGDRSNLMVAVGTNVEYGPYLEYGTGMQSEAPYGHGSSKGAPPYPYLRPAIQECLANFFDHCKTRFSAMLARK